MKFTEEIEKLLIAELNRIVPAQVKKLATNKDLIDESTKVMGFKKITKPGYTP